MALLLTMALALSTLAQADEGAGSALASDERVVFFTTDATLSADGESWNVPIHAWVHELENAAMRRTTIATLLRKQYGIVSTPKTKAVFDRRVRLIIADNERNKSIVIEMAGSKWTLNKTQPNGHSLTLLSINSEKVKQYAKDGQLSFKVANADNDSGSFIGFVNLVSGTGVSVISDFDDTVKVTNVTERAKMLENSLYNEFQSVVGMPLLYRQWAKQGAAFHFVSSSPWQLYEPID